jgi:hypothetical protein
MPSSAFDPRVPIGRSADAVFQRERKWRRWASDADALIQILETAEARIAEHSDERHLSLEVDFPAAGRGVTRSDLKSFTEQLRANFGRVGSVNCIFLGRHKDTEEPHIGLRIRLDDSRFLLLTDDVASLEVRGTDETMVDGVFDQTQDQMVQANRAPSRFGRWPRLGVPGVGLGALFGLLLADIGLNIGDPNPNDVSIEVPAAQIVAIAGAYALFVAALAFYVWVLVPLEYLPPGGETRWQRSKRWAFWVGVGLVLSLAALIVTLAK